LNLADGSQGCCYADVSLSVKRKKRAEETRRNEKKRGQVQFATSLREETEGRNGEETGTGPVYDFFGLPGDLIVDSRPSFFAVFFTQSCQ